jgi:hypothetical protein
MGGRPRGARNKLGEAFLQDLQRLPDQALCTIEKMKIASWSLIGIRASYWKG